MCAIVCHVLTLPPPSQACHCRLKHPPCPCIPRVDIGTGVTTAVFSSLGIPSHSPHTSPTVHVLLPASPPVIDGCLPGMTPASQCRSDQGLSPPLAKSHSPYVSCFSPLQLTASQPPTPPRTRGLTHAPTHSPTHSPTHPPTHSPHPTPPTYSPNHVPTCPSMSTATTYSRWSRSTCCRRTMRWIRRPSKQRCRLDKSRQSTPPGMTVIGSGNRLRLLRHTRVNRNRNKPQTAPRPRRLWPAAWSD